MEEQGQHSGGNLLLAYVCLIGAPLFWAGNFVIARAYYTEIPPVAFNFWRWMLAFMFLAPFALPSAGREIRQIVREWRLCAVLGLTGIALFQTFSYQAVHTAPAVNAALYMSATPILVTTFSWWWFGDRLTGLQALGIAVSLVGVAIVVTQADLETLLALRFRPGDLWMIAAVPLWAIYSVLIQRRPSDISRRSLLLGSILFGLIFLAPLYAWEVGRGQLLTPGPLTAIVLLYVSLFASAGAFLLWHQGTSTVGANKSSLFIHLIPVFSAALGYLFLGEAVWGSYLIGALAILVGILLTTVGVPKPSIQVAATDQVCRPVAPGGVRRG